MLVRKFRDVDLKNRTAPLGTSAAPHKRPQDLLLHRVRRVLRVVGV